MQSRRELLQQVLVLPFIPPSTRPEYQVISEPNCLSQESAEGFSRLLRGHAHSFATRHLIVAAGVARISQMQLRILRTHVEQGACLIWESAAYGSAPDTLLENSFYIKTTRNSIPCAEMYVRYRWPAPVMVRSFDRFTPLECLPEEAIAHVADKPVALRKQVGKGTLIFLGSMLGPHLRAGDRAAIQLARQILAVRS